MLSWRDFKVLFILSVTASVIGILMLIAAPVAYISRLWHPEPDRKPADQISAGQKPAQPRAMAISKS